MKAGIVYLKYEGKKRHEKKSRQGCLAMVGLSLGFVYDDDSTID